MFLIKGLNFKTLWKIIKCMSVTVINEQITKIRQLDGEDYILQWS
jgi:hypothetical protein